MVGVLSITRRQLSALHVNRDGTLKTSGAPTTTSTSGLTNTELNTVAEKRETVITVEENMVSE
jgi:hypothetical protein